MRGGGFKIIAGVLNWFFSSFSNQEKHNIKNICVYSKSKIKTKVINRRLFVHKFCNNSKMFLTFSWAILIRALVFSSSPSANVFFVWVLVFFVSTSFSIYSYLVHKSENRKKLYCHKDWEVSITLFYLVCYNKTQSRSFLIQLETIMGWLWLRKFEQI